jgi:ABC-type antimicrobial peptide transport system permease subunit
VVNEQFARTYFGSLSAIGRTFRYDKDPVEIVGVVRDAFYSSVKNDIGPMFYVPFGQSPFLQTMTYALRTAGKPAALSSLVRDTVRQMNPLVPVPNILTQREVIARQFNQEILFARLSGAFAALALLIACVGLYAAMSYRVTQRTSEIGIRIALGAGRASVILLSLRQALLLLASGLAIGLPLALGLTKLIESFLWGIEPNDPATLAGAVVVLAISALFAGYLPALRAARVHPITALRHE